MDMGLKDKVAIITGGSVGIGLAIAEGLAQEGVHLVLCARQENRLTQQASEVGKKYGVQAIGIKTDITKVEDLNRLAEQVDSHFGGADILINNAGSGSNETVMNSTDDKWQYYWDLHVMASVRMAQRVVPLMQKRGGGVILHNASICATQPLWYEPIYNTTKAALVMFSKCLANELIPFNIRVNVVNAGLVLTPDWIKTAKQLTQDTDQTWEQYLDKVARDNAPINRFASPEEIANLFVFLSSPRASYSVGSTYYADGGMLKVIS